MPRHRRAPGDTPPAPIQAQPQQPVVTRTLPPEMAGAGGLSAADLAAIRGAADDTVVFGIGATLTTADGVTQINPAELLEHPPKDRYADGYNHEPLERPAYLAPAPDEVTDAQRENAMQLHRLDIIEEALEKHAKAIGELQRYAKQMAREPDAPLVAPAAEGEQNAYAAANYALHIVGQKPFDGIEAWRKAGRPGAAA